MSRDYIYIYILREFEMKQTTIFIKFHLYGLNRSSSNVDYGMYSVFPIILLVQLIKKKKKNIRVWGVKG